MMNPLLVLTIAIALVPTPDLAQANVPATIIGTGDGDTLRVEVDGKPMTVRLACIDAPESKQIGGKESAARLRKLLPKNQRVDLRVVTQDRYNRSVTEVFANGQSVNLQMVQEGHAVIYRQYFKPCDRNRAQYLQAESNAKAGRRAFWSQVSPVMPWNFRLVAGKRPATTQASPAPVRTANCSPAYPTVCIPPTPPSLNCKDISHRRFTVLSPDPHSLDKDRNGLGCES